MNICMVQSHSKNNEKLYTLTLNNHIKYCNKFNISYLGKIESYSPFLRLDDFNALLNIYDIVFTIGSDVLITNFNKNIIDFINNSSKPISICIEGNCLSLVNGEIIFFKKCSEILEFFQIFKDLQLKNSKVKHGAQDIFNLLYTTNKNIFDKYINLIPAGILQRYKYTVKDYNIRDKFYNKFNTADFPYCKDALHPVNELLWRNKNDFCLHTIGGNNNDKYELISNILKQYPELN